jgi:nitronate monooxygenase
MQEKSCQDGDATLSCATKTRRADLLPLGAGQSANLSACTDVLAVLTSLVEEVSEIAGPIIPWSAAHREKQILK